MAEPGSFVMIILYVVRFWSKAGLVKRASECSSPRNEPFVSQKQGSQQECWKQYMTKQAPFWTHH